jgi:hypothetical protein
MRLVYLMFFGDLALKAFFLHMGLLEIHQLAGIGTVPPSTCELTRVLDLTTLLLFCQFKNRGSRGPEFRSIRSFANSKCYEHLQESSGQFLLLN